MKSEHNQFLSMVEEYVYRNPDVSPHVSQYAAYGLERKLNAAREQTGNLETALCAALAKRRWKGIDKLIIDRIKDFVALGQNHLGWDSFLEEVERDDKK